jgi:hypothetical protein
MLKKLFSLFIIILTMNLSQAGENLIHHQLAVTLDPQNHYLEVKDLVTIPAGQLRPEMYFLLHGNLSCTSITENVELKIVTDNPRAEDFRVHPDKLKLPEVFACKNYLLKLPGNQNSDYTFSLTYKGKIHHTIKEMAEEYARSFSETPGIIDSLGVYLGGTSYWIPWFNDTLITFDLSVTLPQEWDVVSQGKRTVHEKYQGNRKTRWESPNPSEEVFLVAAKFTEYQRSVGAVTATAFLRTADENLANKYLETTAQYLEMYRQLVGPYPYTKFALVENFWETGYGMPSFTLLGEKIIRFPFILHSSYPHELLHNWWGNGVYVDYDTGNWCEGLTAYMADHLIKEQRGQGSEYRRSTLQRYSDYVTAENDFPLTGFRSRYNAATEAVGYGKSLMLWHMLRREFGDELFVKSFQSFYRQNTFKRATFGDIRQAFENVTEKDLEAFFDQWVSKAGAPELRLSGVKVEKVTNGYILRLKLSQIQAGEVYQINVPVAVYFDGTTKLEMAKMTEKVQTYDFVYAQRPLQVSADPEFDVFRRLHSDEIPPALSKIFGAEKVLILLPSKAPEDRLKGYQELADIWSKDQTGKIEVLFDNEIKKLPADKASWLFGWDNIHRSIIDKGISDYNASITADSVRFGKTTLADENNSFIIAVRHPQNPNSVVVWLRNNRNDAVAGLARKLPHYGKYSYLAFEGDEPTNIAKGQWKAVHSPLSAAIPYEKGVVSDVTLTDLSPREALATLSAVFSENDLRKHVEFLASEELEGRGIGTAGLEKAAEYIAEQFKNAGLQPGGNNDSYFQTWQADSGKDKQEVTLKNVIGILSGKKKEWDEQSVVVCAHYDHLGRGWPDVHKGDEGKIHYGADDNASGVAVMIELAKLLSNSIEPDRTIVFAAFTGEESGLLGSKYYVQNITQYPASKIIGVINFDTVGRLGENKLMVINSSSAREWKFIFMGSGYVTGIESEMITQDLDASDQVSFIEADVPSVQLFSGPHPDYHRPGDTADKIDAAGMVKVAAFGREAVVYLTEREEPMTYQGKKPQTTSAPASAGGGRRVSTGTMPDFAFSGEGVRVAAVSPDSPAAIAGLQEGDVIIQLGEQPVKNLREYSDELKKHQPGDEVKLVYQRNGENISISIKLVER